MASPVNPLAKLRCHCITFSHPADPAACVLAGSQNLDWDNAHSLASSRNLRLEFASKATISKILALERPIPASELLHMETPESFESGSKVVCGLGDEVKREFLSGSSKQLDPRGGDFYVSKVVAVLLLIIILYAAGEDIWMRYQLLYYALGT